MAEKCPVKHKVVNQVHVKVTSCEDAGLQLSGILDFKLRFFFNLNLDPDGQRLSHVITFRSATCKIRSANLFNKPLFEITRAPRSISYLFVLPKHHSIEPTILIVV